MKNMSVKVRRPAYIHAQQFQPHYTQSILQKCLCRNSCSLRCSEPLPALITTVLESGNTNELPARILVRERTSFKREKPQNSMMSKVRLLVLWALKG